MSFKPTLESAKAIETLRFGWAPAWLVEGATENRDTSTAADAEAAPTKAMTRNATSAWRSVRPLPCQTFALMAPTLDDGRWNR